MLLEAGVQTNLKQRQQEKESVFPPNIYDLKLESIMGYETLPYSQYLNLAKIYIGDNVEYDRPLELADTYRNLRNSIRNAGTLDRRLENPEYMKPVGTKFKSFRNDEQKGKPRNIAKLSAFNADKKLAGVRLLVDNMSQKMTIGGPIK